MKLFLLPISLLFSVTVFSQQNKWNIGIVGGPGITALRITNSTSQKPSPTLGFYTGLSAQYNFNEHVALHTELAFDRKGTSDKYKLTDGYGNEMGIAKITDQLNYLTLPVLFRAAMGNKVKYFLQAGPYLSYLLNQTLKFSVNNDIFNYTPSTNMTSSSSTMDFGMSTGLGVMIPVKKFAFSCELRGNYGLVNLIKDNSNSPPKRYNESLNLLIGVSYAFGK